MVEPTNGSNGSGISPEAQAEIRSATSEVDVAAAYGITEQAELRALEQTFRSLETSILLARSQFMRQAGITFDGQRDTYQVLGYNRLLTAKEYYDRYSRGGIAGRIVDALPNACWRGSVELVEDEDPKADSAFEKAWKDLDQKHQIQAKLQRVDRLAGLSTYAVLLIGADGDLAEELPKVSSPDALLYLTPFLGGGGPGGSENDRMVGAGADCSIATYDISTDSPRFGLPLTYQLKRTDLSAPMLAKPVHWTRIIHIAEGLLRDEVYGIPCLERVWNLLDDLDKITGGGAEAFWLRANQGMHIDIDKDMALPDAANAIAALKVQAEEYKHQLTRWLRTRGTKVTPLGSDVANFGPSAEAVLTQIAGAKAMPKRILTGSEMGELASSQDRDNWKDQINGRQTGYVGPYIVRPLVDRLVKYGYLPTPAKGALVYEVRWPHIQTLTEQEKAEGAQKWAQVNSTSGSIIFTEAEIRDKWYAMEPTKKDLEDVQPWRATLALKMVSTNKTQGAIVFTDDEIRKTCYNWEPLTPEEKIPLTAPERVTATAPTPEIDAQGKPVIPAKPPVKGALPRAGEAGDDAELLRILQDAIETGNEEVVLQIVGLRDAALHQLASTQIQLPPDIAEKLLALGQSIPDSDIYEPEGGRETDAHITVKYGLIDPDPELLSQIVVKQGPATPVLESMGPVKVKLGATSFFSSPDYDVVFVVVFSSDLEALNNAISAGCNCAPPTHGSYAPHATVAYVKPGMGEKYAGRTDLVGIEFEVDSLTLCTVDGEKVEVSLAS